MLNRISNWLRRRGEPTAQRGRAQLPGNRTAESVGDLLTP